MEISENRVIQMPLLQRYDLGDDEAIHITKPSAPKDYSYYRKGSNGSGMLLRLLRSFRIRNLGIHSRDAVGILKWTCLYLVLFIMVLMSTAADALGQSYDLRFVEESNNGSTLGVKIQISFSATAALGSSNLVFSYDPAKISTPVLQSIDNFDQAIDSDYAVMTLTSPLANTVSLNIELQIDDAGTSLSFGTWMDVASINFTIIDNSGTADFQWELSGTEQTVVYLDDNSTLLSASGLSGESVPLPVELTSFEAVHNPPHIRLHWATASELNNDYFEVLRSKEGKEWYVLTEVAGHGTTSSHQEYSYLDTTVPGGVWYYRLRQVDYDGAFEYSPIVHMVKEFDEFDVHIFPNPMDSYLQIELSGTLGEDVSFRMIDLTGQEVVTGRLASNNVGRISERLLMAGGLPTGTYILQLIMDNREFYYKLLKN